MDDALETALLAGVAFIGVVAAYEYLSSQSPALANTGTSNLFSSLFGPASSSATAVTGAATLPATSPEQEILARTIWGEARGQGVAGMEAVANVVINRTHDAQGRFPKSVSAVCLQPKQFSCWNANDPNLAKLKAVTTADAQFAQAMQIAGDAIDGTLIDNTNGAEWYHVTGYRVSPKWPGRPVRLAATIGSQSFYVG